MNEEDFIRLIRAGDREALKIFLKDVGVHYEEDWLLRMACSDGDLELTKILLKAGADVYALFESPLIRAFVSKHFEIVKLLIENNADWKSLTFFKGLSTEEEVFRYLDLLEV